MTGTNKYVLLNDIEINDWLCDANNGPLIGTLSANAVIDGAWHSVTGVKLPGCANNCWITEMLGVVKNIAFIDLICADSNPYSTGLFGYLKDGASLENIYVDAYIPSDGSIESSNQSGGVLIGTLVSGSIKNVILNINAAKELSLEAMVHLRELLQRIMLKCATLMRLLITRI